MNFGYSIHPRASLFRTSGNNLLEPPGIYTYLKDAPAEKEFLPGNKCSETLKCFDYNDKINEKLKKAAEDQKRLRRPLYSNIDKRNQEREEKAKKKVLQGKRKSTNRGRRSAGQKMDTSDPPVVQVVGDSQQQREGRKKSSTKFSKKAKKNEESSPKAEDYTEYEDVEDSLTNL